MKYTFVEFIAALESKNFDDIESKWLYWAKKVIGNYPKILKKEFHRGSCTHESCPCDICLLETYLVEYREYYFNEVKWREDNGL